MKKAVVGKLPCGCIMAAVIPHERRRESDEADIRLMIRDGLRVEVMAIDDVRDHPGFLECIHGEGHSFPAEPVDEVAVLAEAMTP